MPVFTEIVYVTFDLYWIKNIIIIYLFKNNLWGRWGHPKRTLFKIIFFFCNSQSINQTIKILKSQYWGQVIVDYSSWCGCPSLTKHMQTKPLLEWYDKHIINSINLRLPICEIWYEIFNFFARLFILCYFLVHRCTKLFEPKVE